MIILVILWALSFIGCFIWFATTFQSQEFKETAKAFWDLPWISMQAAIILVSVLPLVNTYILIVIIESEIKLHNFKKGK